MTDEEPTDPNLRSLSSPEAKTTPLGKIPSKSEQKTEKTSLSIPPSPEGKSEEFKKGYKVGYTDGKNRKQPKF